MALSIDARPPLLTGRGYERAALAITIGIIAWAIVNLANGWVGFATIVPIGVSGGTEAAISLMIVVRPRRPGTRFSARPAPSLRREVLWSMCLPPRTT